MGSGIKFISQVLNQKGAPALYEDIIDNRPAATFEGRLFFATDVTNGDTIFRDNGDGTWSALAGNAGGGGTFINGVTDLTGGVGLGGSLDQNTEILLNGLSFKLTNNGDNFLIDTVNDLYYFGKGNALDAGNGIHITQLTLYTQYGTQLKGIDFNFDDNFYNFGDFNNVNNGTSLGIFDNENIIQTNYNSYGIGLKLDFANKTYQLGDFNYTINGTNILIDDDNRYITAVSRNDENGIKLDFANFVYNFGDFAGANNGSSFGVNDDQQTLTCTNVTSIDIGSTIDGWIKITVDGNYKLLPYYNIV